MILLFLFHKTGKFDSMDSVPLAIYFSVVFIVNCISLLYVYNSIIDLFRKGYQGLKSEFWQLIHRWFSGLADRLMIIGLGFNSPHNLI